MIIILIVYVWSGILVGIGVISVPVTRLLAVTHLTGIVPTAVGWRLLNNYDRWWLLKYDGAQNWMKKHQNHEYS